MPAGFAALIAAQFASALGDNALLIVTMALLQQQGLAAWWAPLLKLAFTLSYVVLAPVLGPLADAFPKSRLMLWMTGIKAAGVLALLVGLHPVLAFCIVGFGAAAYAPAKYGLITELVGAERLIAANGWVEVTVVGALLLGTVGGGLLVGPGWLAATSGVLPAALGPLGASLLAVLGIYATSLLCNLGVRDSGARYGRLASLHPLALWADFLQSNRRLWSDADGALSLAATAVFWGAGAVLQFIVLRWAGEVLAMPLHRAALLQAIVAIGVVAGAAAAGRLVALAQAKRMLWCGVGLGLMLPALALTDTLPLALPLLLGAGVVGGLLVVPLNALLQHRGSVLLSAGRSIAVQGFNENASVLAMLALYAALSAAGLPLATIMWGLGLAVSATVALLIASDGRRRAAA